MPECQNCGLFVTLAFVRVFGNNEGEVFGCPRCTPFASLTGGEAADPRS